MMQRMLPFSVASSLMVLLLLYVSYKMFAPFLLAIFWAVVFSVAFYPFYFFIHKRIKNANIAAALVVLVSLFALIGPLSSVSYLLIHDLKNVVKHLTWEDGSGLFLKKESLRSVIDKVAVPFNLDSGDMYATVLGLVDSLKRSTLKIINENVFTVVHAIIDYFIMLFTLFFLLRDGPLFLERIRQYLPLADEQKKVMIARIKEVIVATLYGGVLIALIHGIVGGLSFYFLDVPSPVLLGFLVFLFSFIPVLGAFSIWGPVAAYLFLSGSVIKGFIMVSIGVIILIGVIDHFLKPKIIGQKANIHTLLIFFGVLGGLHVFGIIGFIAGPLIIAMLLLVLEMIDRKLKEDVQGE
jgi:predicted PurR-regulated permease PerM